MQYSSVMRQLEQYRLNTVYNVSLECLEYGYYNLHGDKTPSISIDNIEAAPHELLGLIRIDNAVTSFFLIFGVCGMRRTAIAAIATAFVAAAERYDHRCYIATAVAAVIADTDVSTGAF